MTIWMKGNNMKVFWYHFNRPATLKAGKPKITVHFDGKCHIVDGIAECKSRSHIRKTQPLFVMKGKCNKLEIKGGIAYAN